MSSIFIIIFLILFMGCTCYDKICEFVLRDFSFLNTIELYLERLWKICPTVEFYRA